jgi:hypothetical protein
MMTLSRLMCPFGKPQYIRSDNCAEFTACSPMSQVPDQRVGAAFITPGRLWQNGFVQSFHGKL